MGYIPPPPPRPPDDLPGYICYQEPSKQKKKTKDERFWDRELREPPPPDYDPSEDNTIKSWWNS